VEPSAKQPANLNKSEALDGFTIFLHFGLMVFGVLAWFTGEWAGDYKTIQHPGFTIHKMLGLGIALFLSARLFHGFWGPDQALFANWVPYTSDRLRLVLEDIRALFTLRLPDRPSHQGLAGLWAGSFHLDDGHRRRHVSFSDPRPQNPRFFAPGKRTSRTRGVVGPNISGCTCVRGYHTCLGGRPPLAENVFFERIETIFKGIYPSPLKTPWKGQKAFH
jgi:hypothetical protein